MKVRYVLQGTTYTIREDLKAMGCHWDDSARYWITPELSKEDHNYKRIKDLADAVEAEVYPLVLHGKNKTIREILNRR